MKKIYDKYGNFAEVSDEDYNKVSNYTWYKSKRDNYWFRTEIVTMHRHILELKKGDGIIVDHINRNRSDNRRCNLRISNPSRNVHNRKNSIDDVRYNRHTKLWDVFYQITHDSKSNKYYLGGFEEEIAKEVAKKARLDWIENGILPNHISGQQLYQKKSKK